MTKYTRQLYRYDCGPTAVANAIKHFGGEYNYKKNHRHLFGLLKTKMEYGTYLDNLIKFLKRKRLPFKYKSFAFNPSVREIHKKINQGQIVFFWFPNHVCLITKSTKNFFYLINLVEGATVKKLSKSRFRKVFKTYICNYIEKR